MTVIYNRISSNMGKFSITPFSKILVLNRFKKTLNPAQNSLREYKKVSDCELESVNNSNCRISYKIKIKSMLRIV